MLCKLCLGLYEFKVLRVDFYMSLITPDITEGIILEQDSIYQFGEDMTGMPEWMPEIAFTVRVFRDLEDDQSYFHVCNESKNLCFIKVVLRRSRDEYVRILLPKEIRMDGRDELENIVAFSLKGLLDDIRSIEVIVFHDTYLMGNDISIRPDLHTFVLEDMLRERKYVSFKLRRRKKNLSYVGLGEPEVKTDDVKPEHDEGATIIIPS